MRLFRRALGLGLAGIAAAIIGFAPAARAAEPTKVDDKEKPEAAGGVKGKPDVVDMVGPVSQDKDLRKLPKLPARQGSEPFFRTRHPRPGQINSDGLDGIDLPDAPDAAPIPGGARDTEKKTPPPPSIPSPSTSTPSPTFIFDGINSTSSGCGCLPPDTDGDVGPNNYIESENSSIRIANKTTGATQTQVTYNSFFSALGSSTPCGTGTQNDGDGIAFYDAAADRWVISDFAFPGFPGTGPFYQCIGVSKTSDPVAGGWWLYALQVDPANREFLGDYPKFGLWPNAWYVTMNEFSTNTTFNGVRAYALDRAGMMNGTPTSAIGFTVDALTLGDAYSLVPATYRFGAPPPGRDQFLLAVNSSFTAGTTETKVFVWNFHPDFVTPSNSTLGTGLNHAPNGTVTVNGFIDAETAAAGTLIVPQTGTTAKLDTLGDKIMYPMYYQNLSGVESLWADQTVLNGSGVTAIRWYQFDVTGGNIPATPAQQQTFDNSADGVWRWMPSLALDSVGNLTLGYSGSSSSLNPSVRWNSRLPGDPANTLGQGETIVFTGPSHQTSSSGRWGDYSATGVDINDGCTFFHTNEYMSTTSVWASKVAGFSFGSPTCVKPLGTLQGHVTASVGGAPISGATVTVGLNTTTTDVFGFYSFASILADGYTATATAAGFNNGSAAVTVSGATTQDFSMTGAAYNACLTDTTMYDFQEGATQSNVDLVTTPGSGTLATASGGAGVFNQGFTNVTTEVAISTTTWGAQTFTPTVTGTLNRVDIPITCDTCSGTTPNLTVELRNATGAAATSLPGTTVLATTTITGFATLSDVGPTIIFAQAVFSPGVSVTSGTTYAVTVHPSSAPSTGNYAFVRGTNSFTLGAASTSANSGSTWAALSPARDFGFLTYITSPNVYTASGNLASSMKDANPASGNRPNWTTLSWNGTTPANTALKFQVAGSNNPAGPFNFVGPDTTSGTFFTTAGGSDISQFDGLRYLKYKSFLSTTDTSQTSTLTDATACFIDIASPGTFSAATPSVCAYGGGPFTYTVGSSSTPGVTYHWTYSGSGATINSNDTASASTTVTFANGFTAGTLSVVAQESGGSSFASTQTISVNAVPTASASPTGPTTICPGGSVGLTGSGNTSGPYSCTWSPATGLDNANSCTPVASPAVTTTYTLTSLSDANGCVATNTPTVTVTVIGAIAVNGSTAPASVCLTDLGGLATVQAPDSGTVLFQWGYRTVSGGAIKDLAGHTGSTYTLQGSDFGAVGTYYLVCTVTSSECGTFVSNEVQINVTSPCAETTPPDVQYFTGTTRNGAGSNILQWFSAATPVDLDKLYVRIDGQFPIDPDDPDATFVASAPAPANTKFTFTDVSVANGTTSSYSLFSYTGSSPSLYSSGKDIPSRPFNSPAGIKWVFSSGGITLATPGVRPLCCSPQVAGAVYTTSNTRNIDAMNLGVSGGDWPTGWIPYAMNAPAPNRAVSNNLTSTLVGGSKHPVFAGSSDGRVYAVDGQTGSLLWVSPVLGDYITAPPSTMFGEIHAGAPNLIMVGANSATGNKFYGLNITNGSILWTFTNGVANNIGIISGQALVDYNTTRVYFTSRAGGSGNSVWALNVSTNPPTLVWAAGGMGDIDADINLSGTTLYAGTTAGKVYALNTTGTQKWTGPFLTGGGPVKGLIWVSGSKLFFSTTSSVNTILDNGASTAPTAYWTPQVSISSPTTPLVYNNRVYVGGGLGKAYSIDATSPTPATPLTVTLGDPATPFQVGSPTRDSSNNLLLFGSEPGHVYAVVPF